MTKPSRVYILWTNADPITSELMVFMYGINAKKHGWFDEVTLVIWGATAKLVAEDAKMQELVRKAVETGVYVCACKACADELGATEALESVGVDVDYLGIALTRVLKDNERLLTI